MDIISGMLEFDQSNQHIDAVSKESSSLAKEDVFDTMTLIKAYHKYKRKYVKHLSFDPDRDNLSKYLKTGQNHVLFSYHTVPCPIGGSVHLL